MSTPILTVGQRLYSLNVGNAARQTAQVLTPVTVTKVGRKYFRCAFPTVNPMRTPDEREYKIAGWKENTDRSPTSQLYASEKDWADEKEAFSICSDIHFAFQYGQNRRNVPLETLRQIHALIPKAT